MITKTTKTILFASLIAALVLPIGVSNMVQAEQPISDVVVADRVWLQNADDHKRHVAFMAYVDHEKQENGWNQVMQKENIRNYNIETKIGQDVDGYELAALFAQKQILKGNYEASEALQKFHDWALSQYDIPQEISAIDDRINEIVGKNNKELAVELVKSLNRMTEHGNVSSDIHKSDSEFWSTIGNKSLCSYIDGCDPSIIDFSSKGERLPNDQPLKVVAPVDSSSVHNVVYRGGSMIIPTVTYHDHEGSMYITYNPCATSGSTCNEFVYHTGSGIQISEEAGPSHVQDAWIYVSMSAWGAPSNSVVVVTGQVFGPVSGSPKTNYDTDGNITWDTDLYNPNAPSQSQAWIKLTTYAYT